MSFKALFFYAGCAVTWLFVLPVLALAGFAALVGYAAVSGLGEWILGQRAPDPMKAREIAHRMCAFH